MKKVFFATLALVAALSVSSCKTDKCKCTITAGDVEIKDKVFDRPDDKKCSKLTTEDIPVGGLTIDASRIANIDCKNYHE